MNRQDDQSPTTELVAEIVERADYPGEAAEHVATALGIPFADALVLVEREIEQ